MRRRKMKLSKLGGSCPGNGHGNVVKAILKGFLLGRNHARNNGENGRKNPPGWDGREGKSWVLFLLGLRGAWVGARGVECRKMRFAVLLAFLLETRGFAPHPTKGHDALWNPHLVCTLVTAPSIFPLPPGWAWRFVRLPPWWNMRLRRWRTGASSPPHTH